MMHIVLQRTSWGMSANLMRAADHGPTSERAARTEIPPKIFAACSVDIAAIDDRNWT